MSVEALFGLKGRVALLTGASSGIGLHLAGVLARAGAAVALGARRKDRVDAAAAELARQGHPAAGVYLDVTQAASIPAAFDEAQQRLGAPVDILVNNAGVLYLKRFLDQQPEEVERLFDTNLKGAFLVAQEAARRMVAIGRGSIINVASTAGLRAGATLSSYCASKAGLIHLSQVMALELAHKGVRVNALCPGNIETEMQQVFVEAGFDESMRKRTPQRRFGKLEDLDGPALLLASDAGRYMTGAVLVVDGGQVLSWM
jgi:NAD(P)-dependent dehydrogenase (short-subunit alcohol dehydrogenase family)